MDVESLSLYNTYNNGYKFYLKKSRPFGNEGYETSKSPFLVFIFIFVEYRLIFTMSVPLVFLQPF